jgi:hypothetical protein
MVLRKFAQSVFPMTLFLPSAAKLIAQIITLSVCLRFFSFPWRWLFEIHRQCNRFLQTLFKIFQR